MKVLQQEFPPQFQAHNPIIGLEPTHTEAEIAKQKSCLNIKNLYPFQQYKKSTFQIYIHGIS